MQFTKTRHVMGELKQGDYYGYDTGTLNAALKTISPDIQLSGTDESTQYNFTVICQPEHETAVCAAVKAHGSEAAVAARLKAKENAIANEPILATISALEAKTLRAQREQLINIAVAVNSLKADMSTSDLVAWLKANFALESWIENGKPVTIYTYEIEIEKERAKLKK